MIIPTIRRARPHEAGTLSEIAMSAKQHWAYPKEWLDMWRDSLTVTPGFLSMNEVFAGEFGPDVVGFYALVPKEAIWELEHLWIRPSFIGQGCGQALFTHAVSRLRARAPGTILAIESDPNAEGFYLKMGATRVGERIRKWKPGFTRSLPYLEYHV